MPPVSFAWAPLVLLVDWVVAAQVVHKQCAALVLTKIKLDSQAAKIVSLVTIAPILQWKVELSILAKKATSVLQELQALRPVQVEPIKIKQNKPAANPVQLVIIVLLQQCNPPRHAP